MFVIIFKFINIEVQNRRANTVYDQIMNCYLRRLELGLRIRLLHGDRAFVTTASPLFNDLPREIRHVTNLNHFKTLLKTFLFRKAYNII